MAFCSGTEGASQGSCDFCGSGCCNGPLGDECKRGRALPTDITGASCFGFCANIMLGTTTPAAHASASQLAASTTAVVAVGAIALLW